MAETLQYRRSRFAARFPTDLLYTPGHYWIGRHAGSVWRIGFTKFAIRMLGEPVEIDFEVKTGQDVQAGDAVGWLEGFKAVTDLLAPMAGRFAGSNPLLQEKVETIKSAPYGAGWLYAIDGTPGDDCLDAAGYTGFLDGTIDRMMGQGE